MIPVNGSDFWFCGGTSRVSGRRQQHGTITTHLEELVCRLLPLLGHGARRRLGERAHGGEEENAGGDADGSVEGDLLALAGGVKGTGAVGTKGDPVGCIENMSG